MTDNQREQARRFITNAPLHIPADRLDDCRQRLAQDPQLPSFRNQADVFAQRFANLDPAKNDHTVLNPYGAGHEGAYLALMHILMPNPAYEAALVNFLRWIPNQDALMWQSGLSLGQFLKGAILTLDAVLDTLPTEEVRGLLEALILKCIDNPDPDALANNYPTGVIPYRKYLEIPGVGFHCKDYEVNNWDVVCGQGLLYMARAVDALLPERRDEAKRWTQIAIERLRRFLTLCYAPEGEYSEGPGYYSYGNHAALVMLDLLQNWPQQADAVASLDTQGILSTPRWLRSLYPGAIPDGTFIFNDTQRTHAEEAAILYWIAARSRNPLAQYLGDALREAKDADRHIDTRVFALLWRDPSVPANDLCGPLTDAFGRYGSVVCRTGFEETATSLLFRCGCHAGAHTHPDRGNILFSAQGEDFLVDAGMFSDRTQPIYANYHTQAEAHNCVFPAGHGQVRPTNEDPREGRLLTLRQEQTGTVIVGEYAATYPDEADVRQCRRAIYWANDGWFLVQDRVEQEGRGLRSLWHVDNRDRQTKIETLSVIASEGKTAGTGVTVCRPHASLLIQPLLPKLVFSDLGTRYQEDDPQGARLLAFDTNTNESALLFLPYTGATPPLVTYERLGATAWRIRINETASEIQLAE